MLRPARFFVEEGIFLEREPQHVSLVVDDTGQGWLITLNMDKTMGDANLSEELKGLGMKVRNNIYSIITAGAEGDL